MLDQIEKHIARELADYHHYPFAQNIYLDIFRSFSHFPLKLEDIKLDAVGDTITYLALVVKKCFGRKVSSFLHLYQEILEEMLPLSELTIQDIVVETYLGCILYYYHPIRVRNVLGEFNTAKFFNEKEKHEYKLKRQTILIFMV